MTVGLAGILEIPWTVLLFAWDYISEIVVLTWGGGFTWILFRSMRQWFKDDAAAARVGLRNEDEIYDRMKLIARDHRPARRKYILTEGLFWLPLACGRGGYKAAKFLCTPILIVMDREQKRAAAESRERKELGLDPKVVVVVDENRRAAESSMEGLMIDGRPAEKCAACGFVVQGVHDCRPFSEAPAPSGSEEVVIVATTTCSTCKGVMPKEGIHRCPGGKKSMCPACDEPIVSERLHVCGERAELMDCPDCDARYSPDTDHECPDFEEEGSDEPEPEESEDEADYCYDCSKEIPRGDSSHRSGECRSCKEDHCVKAACDA